MPITVGFDATAAVTQRAGIGRYTRELLTALSARHDDIDYRAVYCAGGDGHGGMPELHDRFRTRRIPLSDRVMNAVWHRARLPLPVQLWTGKIDLFHSPDFTLPPVPCTPSVVTVHDLAFMVMPECAYPTLREYLCRVVPRSVRRADRIIAVSESTRRDLIERLGTHPDRIITIYEAAGAQFALPLAGAPRVAPVPERDITERFILSVGTLEPRKNYPRLISAYAALRDAGIEQQLIIAGRKGWLYEPVFDALDRLQLRPHVSFLEPDDGELRALYANCDAFVYPSLYEGFGIPLLEALSFGAPVACSNTSSMPEVVGDAAVTFDPTDVAQMTDALHRVLTDADLAGRLRAAGPAQAATFSWAGAAAQTERVYRELAGHG